MVRFSRPVPLLHVSKFLDKWSTYFSLGVCLAVVKNDLVGFGIRKNDVSVG
jgi:hypothetical protein